MNKNAHSRDEDGDQQAVAWMWKNFKESEIKEVLSQKAKDKRMRINSSIKRLFWDVDKDSVDIDQHRFYIISRIIDYGNIDD
ncbi:MAG: hypothetical protein AAB267_05865, partial [Candidatus Desantisbacteria bacterium]